MNEKEKIKELKRLKKHLRNFKTDAINISNSWDKLDNEVEQLLIEKYPFEKDYSEVVLNIIDWVKSEKEKINDYLELEV